MVHNTNDIFICGLLPEYRKSLSDHDENTFAKGEYCDKRNIYTFGKLYAVLHGG